MGRILRAIGLVISFACSAAGLLGGLALLWASVDACSSSGGEHHGDALDGLDALDGFSAFLGMLGFGASIIVLAIGGFFLKASLDTIAKRRRARTLPSAT